MEVENLASGEIVVKSQKVFLESYQDGITKYKR